MPSFCTPADVVAGRRQIEQHLAENERSIEDDHWGVLIPYRDDGVEVPDQMRAVVAARNPLADAGEIVPARSELPAAIQRFIDVGFSKFVLIPTREPDEWAPELAEMAALVRPLEN